MTTVVDVSGSMREKTRGVSRIEAVSKATKHGLSLVPASTSIAVWEFSTELDGKKDYEERIPMSPISDPAKLKRIQASIDTLPQRVKGDTALYDTIWATYQAAQKDYKDGQISTVLLVTDGRNDDPKGGLSLSELKKKLRDAVDPKRPVDISTLAIGEDVNTKELSDIAKITGSGGTVYTAKTPQDVSAVLAASLQNRSSN
nr:VWA domain-containing protein [Dermacoccus sp. Tok2021]